MLSRANAYFYPTLPVSKGQTLLMFFIKFSPVASDYEFIEYFPSHAYKGQTNFAI